MQLPETRSALPDDLAGALDVCAAALAAQGRRPSADRLAELHARLAAPGSLLAVAVGPEGTTVLAIALAAGDPEAAQDLTLSLLVVHPRHRRRGFGTAVLEQLADDGWRAGFRSLHVDVATDDRGGLAFYRAAGLEPDLPGDDDRQGVDGPRHARAQRLRAELAPPVQEVLVRTDGLRLGQLLKLAGLAETGTQARALVQAGEVLVNGEVDSRRGRQLVDGDEVEVSGVGAVVVRSPD